MNECKLPECEKSVLARGYCGMHYARFKRTGDPRGLKRLPPLEQFWSQVDKNGHGGCWLWTAGLRGGYGACSSKVVPSGSTLAHRVAYELKHGPIEKGLHLDHLCRVPACVNPDHLEPVTPAENTRRGLRGELRTHCDNGHELSGHNVMMSRDGVRRRCRACHYSFTKKRRYTEEYRATKRKPCQGCGGPKESGWRRKLCDACLAS